jgi:hypothetical protein
VYNVDIVASDDRLSGCYVLTPTGSSLAAMWGTFTVYQDTTCGYGFGPPSGRISWDGEWFTPRGEVYPTDTIWLDGKGENAGLKASLRMEDRTHMNGWIFPSP